MIKAVLIDIDNTVLDFNESAKQSVKQAFFYYDLEFNQKTFSVFKSVNDELWKMIERGELDRQGLHKVRFKIILERLNLTADPLTVEAKFRECLSKVACPVTGAEEVLKYLKSKYLIYGASNAIYNLQKERLKISGLDKYFNDLFVSEKIGFNKPSKQFFDACFREMGGIKPCETVMVGDSLTADVEGAKNYGITTYWYNHDKIELNKKDVADYVLNNLSDIKKFL